MRRQLSVLQGRFGLVLLAVSAISYLFVALTPFRWNAPRWKENGARVGHDNTLSLFSAGIARSVRSAPLLDTVIDKNEFSLRLRLRSAEQIQRGPARIFTISADPYFRNLTVGQEDHDLVVRLRTPETSPNGLPPYIVDEVFKSKGWHEIDLNIVNDELLLSVDGIEVLAESLPISALGSWDPGFRAALGNELTWDRPWLGEITDAVIAADMNEVDLLRTDAMELPSGFWYGNEGQLLHPRSLFSVGHSTKDLVLNLLCFIPVGFLLVWIRALRCSVVCSIGLIALVTFVVEATQFCFVGRHPSAVDWILNVLGAGFGAWLAYSLNERQPADDLRVNSR